MRRSFQIRCEITQKKFSPRFDIVMVYLVAIQLTVLIDSLDFRFFLVFFNNNVLLLACWSKFDMLNILCQALVM
jgi:hypothetical protein